MEVKDKYLTQEKLIDFFKDIDTTNITLMSTDSYNETLIIEKIRKTGKQETMLACALNMSIVGYGNKKYGNVLHNGIVIKIEEFLLSTGVLLKNEPNKLLKDDDLTPQRLCRVFRYEIQNYIQKNRIASYLFRKYSTRNPKFFDICFRGAEYLDNLTNEQKVYLLETTAAMDLKINTHVTERVKRVFEAKIGTIMTIDVMG
jgi:hypothetical protein